VNPRNKEPQRKKRNSSLEHSRRKARTAFLLLGLITVLLAIILLMIPGSSEESVSGLPAKEEDGKAAEKDEPGFAVPSESRDAERSPAPLSTPGYDAHEAQEDQAIEGAGTSAAPVLYIVIDDVGYDRGLLEPFLSLPVPVTFAVLPGLPESRQSARLIEKGGAEYILHQPMEAVGGEDPGPGVIRGTMKSKQIREVVNKNLKGLPKAKGVNNHMGSRGTADPAVMRPLLQEIGEHHLFFLDSLTTAKSVGGKEARKAGVPFSARNVFLDNEDSREYIDQALDRAWEIAAERGEAVMIGHIWSRELPGALREWVPRIRERGGEFRFLSSRFERM
jgi:hypothetical protein